jgi:hemoglobin-like flavoprotein
LVVADADGVATRFYAYLFDIDPSAARLFSSVDMTAQRAKFMQVLALVVGALDDPDRLVQEIGELGTRHVRYGVQERHFDSVGDALLRAIADSLGDSFDRGVREAWAEAYALVASVMRRALIRNGNESPAGVAI